MKITKKRIAQAAGLAVVLVLAAGVLAPLVDANRFRGRVLESLRQALGREVEIGEVHLDLFYGPGFSVEQVVIHENPRVGVEPIAYVESIEARISFTSVWSGRLDFSKLRLVNPQITLARPPEGGWNFQELLTRTAGAAPAGVHLPELQIRGGRVNFKFGDDKSIFYITDALLDASPPSSPGGHWRVRFEGQPARTDRPAYGFGNFALRGRWKPDRRTGGNLDLTLELEKGSIAELIRFVRGSDIGVHGQITTTARLRGPASNVEVTGRAQVGDIHRWDLLPGGGEGWPVDYRGRIDLVSQTIDVETVAPPSGPPLPLSLRLHGSGLLRQPSWQIAAAFHALPMAPLPEVGRHMGLALPAALRVEGELAGELTYSPGLGVEGKLSALDAELRMPDSPAIRLARADLSFDGSQVRLAPAAFTLPAAGKPGPANRAFLQGFYQWSNRSLDAVVVTPRMQVPEPESAWARLLGAAPLLGHCRGGVWRGHLIFHQEGEAPGVWTGTALVEDTRVSAPGLADPLEIANARLVIHPEDATIDRIQARIGAAELRGEYRYLPKAARPHRFRFVIPEIQAAEIERLLLPSLSRREGFLARALRLGASRVPRWLADRRAEGLLEIGSLSVGESKLAGLRAHVRWDGPAIESSDLSARWGDGVLNGQFTANLRHADPVYRLSGRFHAIPWLGTEWDGKGALESSGTGLGLLATLTLDGSFRSRSAWNAAGAEFQSISGDCLFSLPRGVPQFRVKDLEAVHGDATYRGQGVTGPDGRLLLELTDGQKQLRLSVAL
jgi:hypothetical protein